MPQTSGSLAVLTLTVVRGQRVLANVFLDRCFYCVGALFHYTHHVRPLSRRFISTAFEDRTKPDR